MKKLLIVLFAAALLMGCQTKRVTRISADTETDLSGRWNDTDSRLVSEAIIRDLTDRSIFEDFRDEKERKPVVIVGTIRNKSSEHISVSSFVKDIERELVNSGRVKMVASSEERQELRDEKVDQQSNASVETARRLAQETGADLMLIGTIITMSEKLNDAKVIYYQVDLELIDLETTEKVWMGTKKHKKVISLSGNQW